MYEYVGHMHIHSTHSDGTGTVKEIIEAARKSKLDFVVLTDHNTLQGRRQGEEGFQEGVLVLADTELETIDKRQHCLVLGLDELPPSASQPEELLANIQKKGGISFLAHPLELGSPILYSGRAFDWATIPKEGFDGIEIWNFCSRWRDGARTVARGLFNYYFNLPGLALSPCPLSLKKWDELTRHRRVAAVGGSDAHAVEFRFGPAKAVLFPYAYLFRGVNMHIILKEPLSSSFDKAREQVYLALKNGNSFVALDLHQNSRGFKCHLNAGGNDYLPGEEVPFTQGSLIQVQSPSSNGLIKIIYNGEEVFSSLSKNMAFKVLKPGVFRVEVHTSLPFRKLRPWIYTNPFYVR